MKRWVWFLPSAILIGAVVVYPTLRTLVLSFFRFSLANGFHLEFSGIDNFMRLAVDSRFQNSLMVTTIFTAVSVAIEFAAGLSLALCVNHWTRGRNAIRTILLIPWTLPTAILAVLWAWIFNDQYGILNSLLIRSGMLGSPISWLASPRTAMSAIVIADVWKTVPFVFVILLAGLQSIPEELYEAIQMDGGGRWAGFRFVTWPLLAPFIFVALIFRTIQAFAIFDLVYVLTGGGPGGSTETVSLYAYQTLMRYLDFGYGCSMAIATVILLGCVAIGLYWALLRWYEVAR